MTVPPRRSVRAIVAGLATLSVVAVGCAAEPATGDAVGTPASVPDLDEPDDGTPPGTDDDPAAAPTAITDGDHAGRLVSITTADVTVELVRVLTGDAAVEAAEADGGDGLDDDGTLPNDVYVQDLDRVVSIPFADDAGFRIYDCSAACELIDTTLEALTSGDAVPYGGPNALIDLTVEQGVVVSLEEQYLP